MDWLKPPGEGEAVFSPRQTQMFPLFGGRIQRGLRYDKGRKEYGRRQFTWSDGAGFVVATENLRHAAVTHPENVSLFLFESALMSKGKNGRRTVPRAG